MKKIFNFRNILSTIVVAMSLTSCSDSLLDTEPISEKIVVEENIMKNAVEAEGYMNSCYKSFGSGYWNIDFLMNSDAQTDVSYAGGDNTDYFALDEYRALSTNVVFLNNFNDFTSAINNCNIIINNVTSVSDLPDSRKNEMLGEASLIRALYLFHAVQYWGDFPIVTKTVTSVNSENFDETYAILYPARKPVAEVYDAIIADCLVAIEKAPNASNKFKANKGAANALLAKVYATKPNPDWEKVKQYCDVVISMGYTLLPNYDELFDSNHEGNAESIWEVNGDGGDIWFWGTFMWTGTDWKKFNTPSNKLVKAFDDNNDIKRKASTISTAPVTWSDNYWGQTAFPFANKMRDTSGKQNFYLLRLADIILLKAEALANTNDIVGAMVLVNQIRTRVGIANVTATSQDNAINKILEERFLELAFEGHRWFDLKRTGKTISILSQQKDGNGNILPYASNINENRLLFPIPQRQRDGNPNLTQNPGY